VNAALAETHSRLSCAQLDVSVGERTLVRDLNIDFERAAVTAVLGRNGAGKTLTLHTLAGLRAPARGEVLLDRQPLVNEPRRVLAQNLGLLTQTNEDSFPSSVLDAVLVGRHPHIGFWEWESERDRQLAQAALTAVQLESFSEREVATLSGGERRRVAVATLLSQDPDICLLDEPINHLDPHHQLDVLQLMRRKASAGRTVIMTLHDASLASRFSDNALLLFGNGEWRYGASPDVITEETMSKLYGLEMREVQWPGGRTFVMG
jgi:iron complex transport system ATP-binding protein